MYKTASRNLYKSIYVANVLELSFRSVEYYDKYLTTYLSYFMRMW